MYIKLAALCFWALLATSVWYNYEQHALLERQQTVIEDCLALAEGVLDTYPALLPDRWLEL